MAFVTSFIRLLCVLALVCAVRGSVLRELRIVHSYPEPGNYSYVELVCLVIDSYPSPSIVTGATFQLNGTDIRDKGIVQTDNGTVQLLLTQEMEGFFTCSKNGSVSNNSVGLAAEPSNSKYTDPNILNVELPDQFSTVPRLLQCDIKPGVLLQRYLFYWIMPQNSNYTYNNMGSHELALNITYTLNGSQYQCVVKVDHDGTFSGFYYGTPVKIIVDYQTNNFHQTVVFIILIVILVLAVILVLTFLSIISSKKNRDRLKRNINNKRFRCTQFPSLLLLRIRNLATDQSRPELPTNSQGLPSPKPLTPHRQHSPSRNSVEDPGVPLQLSSMNIPSDMENLRTDFKEKSLGIENLFQVKEIVINGAVRWKHIGLALGLEFHRLQVIRTGCNDDAEGCLTVMLSEWLNGAYNTRTHGEPSWRRLSEAVRNKAGGNNPSLADKILRTSETFSSI